jgi:hypothetical protein
MIQAILVKQHKKIPQRLLSSLTMHFKMDNKELFQKLSESLDNLWSSFKTFQETSTKIMDLVLRAYTLELWINLRETTLIKKSSIAASLQWLK